MGQGFQQLEFETRDFELFRKRLRDETKILKSFFDKNNFSKEPHKIGFEIEGWLTDKNFNPAPECPRLLAEAQNSLIVPEIAKFNFEINSLPLEFNSDFLSDLRTHMSDLWRLCEVSAEKINAHLLCIGTLPTLKESDLCLNFMTDNPRYYALSKEVFKLRQQRPLAFNIQGQHEKLETKQYDLMFEAAATSLQIHYAFDAENAVDAYNNSIILCAPLVALGANSPFFLGKELWDETRIPLFEQAINTPTFQNTQGFQIKRVGLGSGYIRNSLFELYLENLDSFDPLLPVLFQDSPEKLKHLHFQNGTIWRWVRPIVGVQEQKLHMRIEQRVLSSGPTVIDMIANIAFYVGLSHYLLKEKKKLYREIDFNKAVSNFNSATKSSLHAEMFWIDGKSHPLSEILIHFLLPWAKIGLKDLGIAPSEIEEYIDAILIPRCQLKRNGSLWQKAFIEKHGKDFQKLTASYWHNQNKAQAVHTWGFKSA